MDNYVITIARQFGSGGKTIGENLAKELGIPCYGREILRMASDESGISEELYNANDEKVRSGIFSGISKNIYSGQLITPDKKDFVSPENLFYYQAKIIKDLAARESCIIIGRCADFVLRDQDNVVSVFVHAPREYCLERAAERVALRGKDLERFVTKTDKGRGAFYRYYTGREWEDARHYDLCLDSSKLGFDRTGEVIKAYLRIKFGRSQ